MDDNGITIKIGKMGGECRVFVNDIDISKHVRRVVIDAQAASMTRTWIELTPFNTYTDIKDIEDIQFYKGIPEDIPKFGG